MQAERTFVVQNPTTFYNGYKDNKYFQKLWVAYEDLINP